MIKPHIIAAALCLLVFIVTACTVAPTTATENAQADVQEITPQALFDDFVAALNNLAEKYPELDGFPEYARKRVSPLKISYSVGLKSSTKTPDGVKRHFDTKGIYIWFYLTEDYHAVSHQAQHVTDLPNLKSKLFTDVALADDASDGLKDVLNELVEKHKALLKQLGKSANNAPGTYFKQLNTTI